MNKVTQDNLTDWEQLNGKVIQVKVSGKNLVVKVERCSLKDELVRVSFVILYSDNSQYVPGSHEIMFQKKDAFFDNAEKAIFTWDNWKEYFDDN